MCKHLMLMYLVLQVRAYTVLNWLFSERVLAFVFYRLVLPMAPEWGDRRPQNGYFFS